MPVPYNISMQLSILAKLNEDAIQILEQILPYFQPAINLTTDLVNLIGEKRDMPITLESINMEDNYEDDYEDELEYVEIKSSSDEINNRKKLYMDNDYSDQIENQNSVKKIDEEKTIDFMEKKQSTTNLASKRPIQNAKETLDIEPLDVQNLVKDNKKSEKFEIDDPW